MYVNSYKITVKTLGGTTAVFNDAVNAGAGASAYAAVVACEAIHALSASVETVIPYHAVDSVTVELTRTEAEDPDDETCPS